MYYYKFFKVVYKKIIYNNTIFSSKNLLINTNLFICINYFYKLKNKPNRILSILVGGVKMSCLLLVKNAL
jgi:hypothetical protein